MTPEEMTKALAEPFAADEVEFKPQTTNGEKTRALAICYIDARCVMDRLDEAAGAGGWQTHFTVLPDGNVVCALSVRFGSEWVTKEDVGGPSDQPDAGDKRKASFSDALKRAAVQFGVGRYLYRLEGQWVDYDAKTKKLKETPKLPAWALPKPPGPPQNGQQLRDRLYDFDSRLAHEGLCVIGDVTRFVLEKGREKGYPGDLAQWSSEAIPFGMKTAQAWAAKAKEARKQQAQQPVGGAA